MNEGDRLKRILVLCLVVLMMAGCAKEEKTVNRAVFAWEGVEEADEQLLENYRIDTIFMDINHYSSIPGYNIYLLAGDPSWGVDDMEQVVEEAEEKRADGVLFDIEGNYVTLASNLSLLESDLPIYVCMPFWLDEDIDAQDLSLDQGLIATIKTLMRKGEANQLKNGRKMVLDEFTSDENRYSGVEEERKAYLEAMCDNILESLDHDCSPGELTFINGSENRWKCIAEKIKSGEKIGDVYHQGGVEKFCELFEKDYLEYFERIQQDDSILRDIVSNFIGRLMVDYLFASNKK